MTADADQKIRTSEIRKGRRRTAPLSPASIQRAALDIVDRSGLSGLTVRKLAEDLGVTPMAIYRHFENKNAIENTLVDRLVGNYDVTNHDESELTDWLCATFVAMRCALCEHPGVIPLLGGATYSGRNGMLVLEQVLERMRAGNLAGAAGVRLFYVLMAYTIGSVVLMDDGALAGHGASNAERMALRRQRRRDFENFPRQTFPRVVDAAPHLATHLGGDFFEAGLRNIIAGAVDVGRHRA